ncbi:nitroreductase family protein [Defluviicoccus vanus]|uniref:Nitroreductase family protein n=2 Tax=Defluviicoccus vanus TaxID=111831 RepID=A0A7H1N655_9PROT|nr:nitroreductase family protein [Defluviicoccus vanus]
MCDRDGQDAVSSVQEGGAKLVSRSDIEAAALVDFERFCQERYSVRHFSSVPVEKSVIKAAVRIAQKTPSVCNRQCWRVHIFSSEEAKRQVLECQSGNRGFGHEASHVLVVTSDLQPFTGIHERYQGWIDGGMFSMSLVYALHSFGLGSCCLNWSVRAGTDKRLRRIAAIPGHENVIMMIAVGNLVEEFKVACSVRRETDDILTWH